MTAMLEPPSLWHAIADAARRLADADIDEPQREARLLAQFALNVERWRLTAERDRALSAEERRRLDVLVARRTTGEPAARLAGVKEFWSLAFALSPETLVPRPDSEALVAAALRHLPEADRAYRIVDLGTGTGCLLLSLLFERRAACGLGVDRAPGAIVRARANAQILGLADRAAWMVGDWAEALSGPIDLLICNPPYIAESEWADLAPDVREHDPKLALHGGQDGLDAYRALLPDIPRYLAGDGLAVVEIGAGQRQAVTGMATRTGLTLVEVVRDLAGRDRGLVLRGSC